MCAKEREKVLRGLSEMFSFFSLVKLPNSKGRLDKFRLAKCNSSKLGKALSRIGSCWGSNPELWKEWWWEQVTSRKKIVLG